MKGWGLFKNLKLKFVLIVFFVFNKLVKIFLERLLVVKIFINKFFWVVLKLLNLFGKIKGLLVVRMLLVANKEKVVFILVKILFLVFSFGVFFL